MIKSWFYVKLCIMKSAIQIIKRSCQESIYREDNINMHLTESCKPRCSTDKHWARGQCRSCGCDARSGSRRTRAWLAHGKAARSSRAFAGGPCQPRGSRPPAEFCHPYLHVSDSETPGCLWSKIRHKTLHLTYDTQIK